MRHEKHVRNFRLKGPGCLLLGMCDPQGRLSRAVSLNESGSAEGGVGQEANESYLASI